MLEADTLAAAAVDAATARKLEQLADDAATADDLRLTLLTRARDKVTAAIGEEAATIAGYEYQQRSDHEPDRVVIELEGEAFAGVKLEIAHRGQLHGLVTCPLCNAWDQSSRETIMDLADLGELLTHGAQLVWHDAPDTKPGQKCNGLHMEDKPEERESWRVDTAGNAEQLYKILNLATADGYRPMILTSPTEGFIIVGKRVGDRFNKHYDQGDEEPF